jgi:hypothetical protein
LLSSFGAEDAAFVSEVATTALMSMDSTGSELPRQALHLF